MGQRALEQPPPDPALTERRCDVDTPDHRFVRELAATLAMQPDGAHEILPVERAEDRVVATGRHSLRSARQRNVAFLLVTRGERRRALAKRCKAKRTERCYVRGFEHAKFHGCPCYSS